MPRSTAVVGAVLLVAAVAGTIGFNWVQHRREGIAGYQAWVVAGRRCAPPPNGLAAPDQPPQVSAFGGAAFTRQHGATQCSDVASDGGRGSALFQVCQFDHPGVVEVSTRRGVWRFWPGAISPATVSVRNGVADCVIGASQDFGHPLVYDPPPAPAARKG
ncbi:MAG TPA: hypothetical protein VH353_04190 [Caulobacteraceae bacterium]|jgi:hypothetical protein|nr:hypothetical protein [Caulobacteraceae bacterium]